MARPLLKLSLGVALAAPGGLLAQESPPTAPDAGQLAPGQPPFSEPLDPAPLAEAAEATAPGVEPAPPPQIAPPTTMAPVLVEAKPREDKTTQKIGGAVGGLMGGAAGSAAGPVGKFAGALVGKRIIKSLLGGKKKDALPEVEVAQRSPAATAAPATAEPLRPPEASPHRD